MIKRLLHWLRNLGVPKQVDDTNIFKHGFVTPFNCPLGVVHEVYSATPCGSWGTISMGEKTGEIKGTMYSIRAEIEVLTGDRANQDWAAFAADAMGYLKANPHAETKRVVQDAWVTEDDLIKNDASVCGATG